jgi:hypothetical protein
VTSISKHENGVVIDNSHDNFSGVSGLVLVALQTQNTLTNVALSLDKDKSNVRRSLRNLIKTGFVERMGAHYILSGKGHLYLKNRSCHVVESPLDMTTSSKTSMVEDDRVSQPVEAHNISFNVLLWSVPEGWERWMNTCCGLHLPDDHDCFPHDLKRSTRKFGVNKDMKGWEPVDISLYNGFSFRVHPKGVMVHIPGIVADKSSTAAKIAFKRLVSILPKLERWLKLNPTQLYKQGRLNIKLVSTHYALFEHEFAKWWVNVYGQPREKFLVKADDGTLLLYLDNTPKNSIETSEPEVGEMVSDSVQRFMKSVVEDDYIAPNEAKARVEALESGVGSVGALLSGQLVPVLSEFSVQMAAHVGTAVAVHHGAESLNVGAVALTQAALVMQDSSKVQADSVKALVEELRAERLMRKGGGFGWLRSLVGSVLAVVGVVFGKGWLW